MIKRVGFIFVLFFVSKTCLFAQFGKEGKHSKEELNVQVDSLQKFNTQLVAQNDSLRNSVQQLDSMVQAWSDKYKIVLDSVRKEDSIKRILLSENKMFRDAMGLVVSELDFPNSALSFIGNWNVFAKPVLLKDNTPNGGLLSLYQINSPDSLIQNAIVEIQFVDKEIAVIIYGGGKTEKCFYKVDGFSKTTNYSISFSRFNALSLKLHVNHVLKGVQVSYEMPGNSHTPVYYYGYMRRKN